MAPQTFTLGSDWPYWGEDVCLELAVHRRALQEGWVPQAWEVPDMDSDLVTYLECQHKTAEGGCCSFHIRVEVDEERKRNITVQVCGRHNHAPVPAPSKDTATKCIFALEKLVKKSALEELKKVKRTPARNRPKPSVLREKQWVILRDVEIALGRVAMERLRVKATKNDCLVLESEEPQQVPIPESTPTSNRRQTSNPSPSVDSPSRAAHVVPTTATSASSGSSSLKANGKTPRTSSKSSSATSDESRSAPSSSSQRPSTSTPSRENSSQRSPIGSIEKAKRLPARDVLDLSGNFFETPSWPDLHSFRTSLSLHSSLSYVEYVQAWPIVLPGTDQAAMSLSMLGTPDPPQLSFRCSEQGCQSKIVIDRQWDGFYALQTARSVENHNHGGELPLPAPVSPAAAITPAPSLPDNPALDQSAPTPRQVSKKRAIEEPFPSTSSKRSTAQPSPALSEIGGSVAARDQVKMAVEESYNAGAVDSQSSRPSPQISIREDSPSPLVSPDKLSPKPEREAANPPPPAPLPMPTLAEYLSSLDTSGAYDFSECLTPLVRRGVKDVAQLRLWAANENRLKFLMQVLQKADEKSAREEGGEDEEASLDAGEFRREIFKELFLGDCDR